MMSWNDYTHNFEIIFTLLQAILALLASRVHVAQASSITISPSSVVFPSSTIQDNSTTSSASLYAANTISFTKNINASFVASTSIETSSASLYAAKTISFTTNINASFVASTSIETSSASLYVANTISFTTNINASFVASTSSRRKISTISRHTTAVIISKTIALPITTISVTQSGVTTTSSIPTTAPTTLKGLPDGKVIIAIAGVLGAILLILFVIIVWSLCIVETLERRPSSRVHPSEVSGSVSELV